jgi:hypothetical protein
LEKASVDMPARAPETAFYHDDANYTLWRDISRLYEEFVGDGDEQRKRDFSTVMDDILGRLNGKEAIVQPV